MARPVKKAPRRSASWVRRKNVNIDQVKLDRVRAILGAESETEAIDQALSMLLLRDELLDGVARIAGTGGVTNFFEGDIEP
jgi:hypothetical protein